MDEKLFQVLSLITQEQEGKPSDHWRSADWPGIFESASKHMIAPMLLYTLKKTGIFNNIPEDTGKKFENAFYRNCVRTTFLLRKTQLAVETLKQNDIDAIPLKGVQLSHLVYENPGLRFMKDIDLLVREKDLNNSLRLLRDCGIFHAAGDPSFDIHWTINRDNYFPFTKLDVDENGIWKRALNLPVHGNEIRFLSMEDLFLHLCLHLAFHRFQSPGIRSLVDIREVVRRFGRNIDWRTIVNRADSWGASGIVSLVSLLANELLDAGIPGYIIENKGKNVYDDEVISWARERIVRIDEPPELSENFYQCIVLKGIWEKARAVKRLLVPPPAYFGRSGAVQKHRPMIRTGYIKRFLKQSRRHLRLLPGILLNPRKRKFIRDYAMDISMLDSLLPEKEK